MCFFVDPLSAHPHEPDVLSLQRLCNVHNVAIATNVATATLLAASLEVRLASFQAAAAAPHTVAVP